MPEKQTCLALKGMKTKCSDRFVLCEFGGASHERPGNTLSDVLDNVSTNILPHAQECEQS